MLASNRGPQGTSILMDFVEYNREQLKVLLTLVTIGRLPAFNDVNYLQIAGKHNLPANLLPCFSLISMLRLGMAVVTKGYHYSSG